ncbi:unnamed protein product [Euphydryas editha]|uniref:EGF-like domain-containing protein n=1 Tax=Euphydryas editha TaxID=104508 RepID=A0AAU9UM52_EUPED|nr:unnamed protein product [Euphydryas editha]
MWVYCELGPAGKALSERCAAAPCLHAVSCRDLANGFRCECEAGWTGARCDAAADACARGCLNGGTCRADGCECRAGFGGALCDLPLDCRATDCPTGQDCVEQGGAWRCAVAVADSPCTSSPCHNGTCLALDSGVFHCQCPPGNNEYSEQCDKQINKMEP